MTQSFKHISLILLNRLASLLAVMFGVSFLTFLLYYFSPGDKALAIGQARYGGEGDIQPEIAAMIREEFGLDKPLLSQFLHWLGPLLQGDFGKSFVSQEEVWVIFVPNVLETLSLALTALIIGLCLAFVLATLSVWKPGSLIDRFAVAFASIGAAMPSFWLGLLLILFFSATLQWLPAYGSEGLEHLILPATTLGLWVTTSQTRLFRSFLLEAKAAPHLEALRLRGVSESELFWKHILRHAMIPAVTMIGVDLAGLLEGAVIVEVIFSRNGIGALFVHSVLSRDYPLIMFLVLFSAFSYVLINTLVEIVQDWLVPIKRVNRGAES
ncbi:ABC transporter permease [Cohaesibacter gelatinilyticus]|uniref:Peptide/nickel transport system permease protein n=1 Tax=Cohaesibacter gelatinilyticus TaxID=372072 RepID=A0A285PMA3_9HYPH|nr:ABC transporter permease [Cohaesibacter gelatinilyticus]SNZ21266.1 peptide/nickel transport system permease protein [Cohaesibacter gelatinilyticus]